MKDWKDKILIETISDLDGHELIVHLKNGEIKKVWNIAFGDDEGDEGLTFKVFRFNSLLNGTFGSEHFSN